MAISQQWKCVIIVFSILLVVSLTITLPLIFCYKFRNKSGGNGSVGIGFSLFEDNDNNTLVNKDTKNEVERLNMTLSDNVRQHNTKKDNISTYNDIDSE